MAARYIAPLSQSSYQQEPQLQSSYAPKPALFSSYAQPSFGKQSSASTYAGSQVSSTQNSVAYQGHLHGNSRIEYIPYQRKVIDYEQQVYTQTVPKERYVTDYYAIEHTTNYIPQTYYDSYVDYVPVQRYQERVQYYPVENSRTLINKLY